MHCVGLGDALQYLDRVRTATMVSTFLGSGSLQRGLLALLAGSVGFGCTTKANDSTIGSDHMLFINRIAVIIISDFSTYLTTHLNPH